MRGHIDLDFAKYSAACAGETRSVIVTHKTTGRSIEVATRTDFYGDWRKKAGGKLNEINAKRDSPFTWDEFEYEDKQVAEDLKNVLHSAKLVVEKSIAASGAESYKAYIGKGDSFRVELSTLLKYKAQRTALLKPLLLDEVAEYLTKKFKAEVVTSHEVDDRVVMNSWGSNKDFVIGLDKDYYSAGIKFFNVNKPEEGIVENNCFGKLYLNSKNEVKGFGRMFKYFQICSEDMSDNYKANCFSDIKWGAKSAYKALSECTNDKQAWEAMLSVFNILYPESKIVKGWRGEDIEIDALYVFQEMMNMVHLHRWENDFINVESVMDKMSIKYE